MAVDLQDLKTHLNVTRSDHDSELLEMLAAATRHVEKLIGPLVPQLRTEIVRYGFLSRYPVVSVSTPGVTVEDARTGLVTVPFGTQVTYLYGWDGPTPTQRQAILLTAAHLWETQRGTAPTALQGDDTPPVFNPALNELVPPRAMQLLLPDMPVSGFA